MNITLKNTNSSEIASAIRKARVHTGMPSGQVFTLIVVASVAHYADAAAAAKDAARTHPSRVLIVVQGSGKTTRLDAEIELGEDVPGEVITLRVSGELLQHTDSILLPLLLRDTTTVIWWPFESPKMPGDDPIGKLAVRRITDAAGVAKPLQALRQRAEFHSAGDTDLTWTRLTPWRALLAAALDQYPTRIDGATVEADSDNAPAELMAAWLQSRLNVPVERTSSHGPGLTAIRLHTPAGDIAVIRTDGQMATYEVPGQPKRQVALRRRDLTQLLTEELGRMDSDDIYDEACRVMIERSSSHPHGTVASKGRKAAPTSPVKKAERHLRSQPRTSPSDKSPGDKSPSDKSPS